MRSQPDPANDANNPNDEPEHLPCYCKLEPMAFSANLHVMGMRLLVFGHLDYSICCARQNSVIPGNDVGGRKWARDAFNHQMLRHAALHSA